MKITLTYTPVGAPRAERQTFSFDTLVMALASLAR